MKKILLMVVAAMMATVSVKAQHREGMSSIQPRVGITVSTLLGDDDAKSKVNFTYGAEGEYFITDQFSVAGGVLFTTQGAKYSTPDNYTMNIYYTAVPITANYYVLPGLALKAGIQPAYRLNTKVEENGERIDLDKALLLLFEDDDVKLNRFDLSFPVGLSYNLLCFVLDARYNFGVTNIFKGLDDHMRNSSFVVTLGVRL